MAKKPSLQQIAQLAQQADALFRSGQPHRAVAMLDPVMPHASKSPDALLTFARSLAALGQHENSVIYFRRAVKLEPSRHELRTDLALALKRAGDYNSALEQVRRARESDQWHPKAVIVEAELQMDAGNYQDAIDLLDAFEQNASDEQKSPINMAHLFTTRTRMVPKHIPAEQLIEGAHAYAEHESIPVRQRALVWFCIGSILDKLGRYDEAMEALATSKKLQGVPWDAAEHTNRIDACAQAWTSPDAAKIRPANIDGSSVVFILGMPRSGSSLLEQMLSRHPEIHALGERNDLISAAGAIQPPAPGQLPIVTDLSKLTPDLCRRAAAHTLQALNASRPAGVRYVIDKQPFNFVYVPLMARLLPGCRVLHTLRDPRDNAVSYYMQWFSGHHGQANSFDTIGRYYRDYRRFIDACARLQPPELRPEMLDVRYEHVVTEPERVMREVHDFLGLEYDPAVLDHTGTSRIVSTASRDQVKSALYTTSVERWKRYEKHLGPIAEHAGEYIES